MPNHLAHPLVVGISSRALFDLEEENRLFDSQGTDAFNAWQIAHEREVLGPGPGFPLVRALLRLNDLADDRLCEVVVMSKNSPHAALRVRYSIEHHALDIVRSAWVSGAPLGPYIQAFRVDLFLSRDHNDVQAAFDAGIAAGLVYDAPPDFREPLEQIRIAFDADAVVFSDESERIYREQGMEAFLAHERENARTPLADGPFARVFRAIALLQSRFKGAERPPIRTAIVTARGGVAQERVVRTLHLWDVRVDEMFCLSGAPKTEVLRAFRPHIFFDDQHENVERASVAVPAARVPSRLR